MTATDSLLLVVRRDGSSSSRRQRRFKTQDALESGIERARAQGFNTFWVYGPSPNPDGQRLLVRQWTEGEPTTDRDAARLVGLAMAAWNLFTLMGRQ